MFDPSVSVEPPAAPVPAAAVDEGSVLEDALVDAHSLESMVNDVSVPVFEPVDEVSDATGVGGKTPTFGGEVT